MRAWNDHPPGRGLCYRARVEPRQIGYLCAVTEGHEGLAVVRTKDEALGIVEFWVSPLQRETFEDFLRALAQELDLRYSFAGEPNLDDLGHVQ